MSFKKKISRNLLNVPGWRTNRKIVVIESDDWGSIRVSSKTAYEYFLQNNFPVDECAYNSNDSLESNDDMEMLFEVLSSVKDIHNNPAVITANNIVANPEFDKIKAANFEQYFYEPFTATLRRYPKHERVEQLYREGIEKKLFKPQFHGREHVNTHTWLKALQQGDKAIRMAFDHAMFSVHSERNSPYVNEMMNALDGHSPAELHEKGAIITDGLQLFKNTWGFHSKSFIAPCYIWQTALETVLAAGKVEYIQGMVSQTVPVPEPGYLYIRKYHYQGQVNRLGQRYLVRNAFFEPATNKAFDWVDDCLQRIDVAFRWNKPAIISAHRVNFMGFINPDNRGRNLTLLKKLLTSIQHRWPETEFMSSDQLGDLIKYKK